MYFNYDWIKEYLEEAPSLEEAARILNQTGLETEVEGTNGLEIEHTVNRPDAMCHYGLAREISVKTGLKLVTPPVDTADWSELEGWKITSEEEKGCWRYMGVLIENTKNTPSPAWLKEKLDSIEQTSHGLIVDLTNFLLWEFGHPSHAFDADLIDGKEIRIRYGREGEELTSLDGKNHKVNQLLCIADREKPIALAGVMGGQNSEVSEKTHSLLLELAMFNPVAVRHTGKKTLIQSDAKHRFERGVDEESMDRIIRRFVYLLKREQPDITVKGLRDYKIKDFKRANVTLRVKRLNALLGITLDKGEIQTLLERMDFQPQYSDGVFALKVPGYKVDVTREVDVIEEIIRFKGLDILPSTLPAMPGSDFHPKPEELHRTKIRNLLKELCLQEVLTYSFLSEKEEKMFQSTGRAVEIRNPMSESSGVLRRNIQPQLVKVAKRNISRGQKNLKLFELGHVFKSDGEHYNMACLITQSKEKANWWNTSNAHPFYEMKGILETLAAELGWPGLTTQPKELPGLDPQQALAIQINGGECGWFGSLKRELLEELNTDEPVIVMELELDFLKHLSNHEKQLFKLSPFPSIQIDMAFVLDEDVKYDRISEHIQSLDLVNMESMELFDVYSGKSLAKGKKSLGFRLIFRAEDRTLTSDEVNGQIESMIQSVKKEFNAEIRS
ncbi:MAG: phenylalanine--tRNA ligase subunit beta [Acidobacteria bacterium]|nr:MAG: phenylalanine--tRNA ligase subunit beta [Acidobacteriota bacterium]